MSERFMDRYARQLGHDPFDPQDEDGYRAWVSCQQGAVASFHLVPAAGSDEPERFIPYLQPIAVEFHPASGQVAILCYSMGVSIFLQGRGLRELAVALTERRVKSLHEFDSAIYPTLANDRPVITQIQFEQSS